MSKLREAPDRRQLAGLLFELASQLHVERAHRVALQALLEESGVVDPGKLRALAGSAASQRLNRAMLEESIARLLRVLAEDADPRRPLRAARGKKKRQGAKP